MYPHLHVLWVGLFECPISREALSQLTHRSGKLPQPEEGQSEDNATCGDVLQTSSLPGGDEDKIPILNFKYANEEQCTYQTRPLSPDGYGYFDITPSHATIIHVEQDLAKGERLECGYPRVPR